MLRGAIFAGVLLVTGPSLAAQTPDEAYGACLVGHTTLGATRNELSVSDAFEQAVGLCADLAAQVPEDYCPGESCGPGVVEEDIIHFIDAILAPKLMGFTIDGELGAEY